MTEECVNMDNGETKQSTVKVSGEVALLAWALILGGVVVAIFILKELLSAYLAVDGNLFVGELTRRLSDTTLMTLGEFPVIVTEQGATILAYFVFIPIALLGIHVAVALIRAGSHILSPVFPYQISRLKQRIDRLGDKLDKK
ncbi:MAG: hypothetical protein ACR2QW_08875 [bacterium]